MLTHMADTRASGNAIPAGFQDDLEGAAPLRLGHRIAPGGEAVAVMIIENCGRGPYAGLLATHLSFPEIAGEMFLSRYTVK